MIHITVIVFTLLKVAASVPVHGKIVGGVETTISDYPYQLVLERYIFIDWAFHCGAVIIGPNTALTTGSCVQGNNGIRVKSGTTEYINGKVHDVVSVTIHPDYVGFVGYANNDIAIIVVKPDFATDQNTKPIELAFVEPPEGANAKITGWGTLSENGVNPAKLHVATVPIVNRDSCNSSYDGQISEGMICAGLESGGKDTCAGDRGGPLAIDGVLCGLTTYKPSSFVCARPGFPGVYTNIAKFAPWVQEQIQLAEKARLAMQQDVTYS